MFNFQETLRNSACTQTVHVSHMIYFHFFPVFSPKFELQNLGCSLSASAAYMQVSTVHI